MALQVLPCCWAHLAGVLGGEKMYLGSRIIIKINPALSLAIGGRDGMDAGGGHWMTYSINRRRLGIVLVAGDVGHIFS